MRRAIPGAVQPASALGGGLVVGVDVGATKVAAHQIALREDGGLEVGPSSCTALFPRASGFRPLPPAVQVAQLERGELDFAPGERDLARAWVSEVARCVAAVARQAGRRLLLVGVAAPGRKTPDGAGTAVVRHGPRIPAFAERLERALRRYGLELLAPAAPLSSDGECGALGERLAAGGALRGVADGYYLGPGTGLAEALVAGGRAQPLDAPRFGLPPAWRLRSEGGVAYEDLLSMQAVNAAFAGAPGTAFPEELARRGDAGARAHLERVGEHLAAFLARRLEHLSRPLAGDPLWLERVVVGQRMGRWLADPPLTELFGRGVRAHLAAHLAELGGELATRYLDGKGAPREGLVVGSTLRAAPAVGAAALAWERFGG